MAKARKVSMKMIGLLLMLAALTEWTARPNFAQSIGDRNRSTDAQGQSYLIEPGDIIEVLVQDAPELSDRVVVNSTGTFLMDYLGRITAARRTEKELADSIADGLRGRYLKDPKVTVRVINTLNRIKVPAVVVFYVAGAVNEPGQFPFKVGMTLRQAMSLAKGLTLNAEPKDAIIFRVDQATGNRQEIKVNIGDVMKGIVNDVAVLPGDLIMVPGPRTRTRNIEKYKDFKLPLGPVPPCVKGKPCLA